jgi:phospholipase/carboxylesterase
MIRVRPPLKDNSRRVMLLLHGWTGDENAMSVFDRLLNQDYWLISPRGPIPAAPSGFGWVSMNAIESARFNDFSTISEELDVQVQHWLRYLGIGTREIDVMGFSQGGALGLCYLIHHPERIERIACLSGFLPKISQKTLQPNSLTGKSICFSHGTLDETIPVQFAREAADLLSNAGAQVDFCEDPTGHKLGSGCSKRLSSFFS